MATSPNNRAEQMMEKFHEDRAKFSKFLEKLRPWILIIALLILGFLLKH